LKKTGFLESNKNEIEIDDISYLVFEQIMGYLYSGEFKIVDFVIKQLEK
jgi:hypothetical protein